MKFFLSLIMVSQENADVREIKEELSSQEEERFSSEIFFFFFFLKKLLYSFLNLTLELSM